MEAMKDIKEIKAELTALRKEIRYHNNRYYNLDEPEISDYEYDQLMLRLKAIEQEYPELITEDSPTQKVGGTAKREAGVLVPHDVPMLSLEDVFSEGEVRDFVARIQGYVAELGIKEPEFVVEEKIDGLSLALRYENGQLVTAVTRGDGVTMGEDVTENARVIGDVVETLKDKPEYLEIRGEVYMTREAFEHTNDRQELLGLKQFANPRNCAAGTLRQLDSRVTKERHLSLFIFNLQTVRGREFATHTDAYEFMKRQGITVIHNYQVCRTADQVWEAIQAIGASRAELPYDIDGAVVKLNDLADRETIGATAKVPRWAVAYKYPPEEKETVVRDIELSVGRTGRIAPTAVFDTIQLCGTKVNRATLHNQDFIDQLDIRIGDTVRVYKSGEIIPKIRSVAREKRPADSVPFVISDRCPACGSQVNREPGTADIRCTNPSCPAQRERHIIYFCSREAMDIKGVGESAVVGLVKGGYVKNVADLFRLKAHRDRLIEQGIIGKEKGTDKVLAAIEKAKGNEPWRLLTGLGINGVGKTTAKSIMKHFKDICSLMDATEENLLQVKDIGEVTAAAMAEYFRRPESRQLMVELESLGLKLVVDSKEAATGDDAGLPLSGLTFVITGKLPALSREEAADFIEEKGGKVSGSVSKKTSYLLAGEDAGSKLIRAQALGVKIIDENELRAMCE